jgi:hypothetical protein
MTYNLIRYSIRQQHLQNDLWRLLSELSGETVDLLLENLAFSVSNGFFGLAGEISDQLRSRAANLLDIEPKRRVCVEIEQMKRLFYMGYREPVLEAADRVLLEISRFRHKLDAQTVGLWEFEAIGFKAWLAKNPEDLESIIAQSEVIVANLSPSSTVRDILNGFLEGERGRLLALRGDREGAASSFKRGMDILRSGEHWRCLAHLEVYFVEHLVLLKDWKEAVRASTNFLNEALGFGLRSHLLLRIVLLLLKAPESYVPASYKRQLRFRCWILVHAMGLSQYHTVFPLLAEAREWIEHHAGSLLFEADSEAQVRHLLMSLDHAQMERVLAVYYSCLGYEAILLPEHEVVLDILAMRKDGGGIQQCIGIQVKHWTTKALYKEDIPDEVSFQTLKKRLRERPPHCLPSSFHWYCTSGVHATARELLELRIRNCFGESCDVYFSSLTEFTQILLHNLEWLSKIIFSIEIEGNYPSMRTADDVT